MQSINLRQRPPTMHLASPSREPRRVDWTPVPARPSSRRDVRPRAVAAPHPSRKI